MVKSLFVLSCAVFLAGCQTTATLKHYGEIACDNKQHMHAALDLYAPEQPDWSAKLKDAFDIICAMILPESK